MALVKLYSGLNEDLATKPIEEGSIYFVTDTNEIYVDLPNGSRTSFTNKINLDDLYTYMRDRLFSDPENVFQGATETSDGTAGLVPIPKAANE